MGNVFLYRWGIIPLWLLLTFTVFLRNPLPVDETRYLSVAWEMWGRHDFWVPYLNGLPYSHKPPLLFWLFQLGWAVFGVNQWWPALVGPLAALTNLLLTRKLAEKLWPEQPDAALLAPWILIATLLWTLFATTAMFDILLTCLVLLGMLGLLEMLAGAKRKACFLLALATGLGLLAKGPVIFVHLLPVAVLTPVWMRAKTPPGWLVSLLPGLAVGILIALAWAIPAAVDGGAEYAHAIFWRQVANRAIATEIHVRPFYWYLLFLPLILFPWIFWSRFWSQVSIRRIREDQGLRFCLVWFLAGLGIFSCISSKQIHYLVPLLPAFALLVARILTSRLPDKVVRGDLLLVLVLTIIGLFLVILPDLPWFSGWRWVQTIQPVWGLSVLAIAICVLPVLLLRPGAMTPVMAFVVVLAVFVSVLWFFRYNEQAYNLKPAALRLKNYQDQGVPIAFVGTYHGQLNFLGRLTQSVPVLEADAVAAWVVQHPDGYLLSVEKQKAEEAAFVQGHREYWLVFRAADQYQQLRPL
jgi:4-amino-4-deoxy-L-arabinose transferase-like glycosyltransferase